MHLKQLHDHHPKTLEQSALTFLECSFKYKIQQVYKYCTCNTLKLKRLILLVRQWSSHLLPFQEVWQMLYSEVSYDHVPGPLLCWVLKLAKRQPEYQHVVVYRVSWHAWVSSLYSSTLQIVHKDASLVRLSCRTSVHHTRSVMDWWTTFSAEQSQQATAYMSNFSNL